MVALLTFSVLLSGSTRSTVERVDADLGDGIRYLMCSADREIDLRRCLHVMQVVNLQMVSA
jgi:hypothetical protein